MRYTIGETIIKNRGQIGQMSHHYLHQNQPHFMPPTLISGLIHYAEQHQLDYFPWFDGLDIRLDQLRQGEGFLDFKTISQIIQRAIKHDPKLSLGLLIGSNEALISMGILGFTMRSCKNIEEALKLGLHYHPISGSALDLQVQIEHHILELTVTERQPNAQLLPFFCEEVLASITTFLKSMVGEHKSLLSIELSYSAPENISLYQHIFNCPITFNATRNCIGFDANILSHPLNSHSPANYMAAIQICEQTYASFLKMNQPDYHHKIYHLIEKNLPERLNMEQIAQLFKISERQLRRVLLIEGLNFQSIRQEVLQDKAKQLINENCSITEISTQLGFSELREFRRAFKKWTGEAPSRYKKTKLLSSVF